MVAVEDYIYWQMQSGIEECDQSLMFSRVLPLLLSFGSRTLSTSLCISWCVTLRSMDTWSSSYCCLSFSTSSVKCCRACTVRCNSCGLRARDADLPLNLARVSLHLGSWHNDSFAKIYLLIIKIYITNTLNLWLHKKKIKSKYIMWHVDCIALSSKCSIILKTIEFNV